MRDGKFVAELWGMTWFECCFIRLGSSIQTDGNLLVAQLLALGRGSSLWMGEGGTMILSLVVREVGVVYLAFKC